MNTYTHIITTRFNVPTESWTTTRTGHKALSEEWLRDRFEIFGKYCFPSFKNQSEKNFIWLVFFDEQTNDFYREKIKVFKKEFSNFTPVFVKDFPAMAAFVEDFAQSQNTDFIISADIDNDDMLHRDYVKTVQQYFQPRHDFVIDLRIGLQLAILPGNKATVSEAYMAGSPFVSLVEKTPQAKTVIKDKHPVYAKYPEIAIENKNPMYIQLIHQFNMVNNETKGLKRLASFPQQEYGIVGERMLEVSKTDALLANLRRLSGKVLKKLKVKI